MAMNKLVVTMVSVLVLAISGCAKGNTVIPAKLKQSTMLLARDMSCKDLKRYLVLNSEQLEELEMAEQGSKEISTGAKVATGLLFWPALFFMGGKKKDKRAENSLAIAKGNAVIYNHEYQTRCLTEQEEQTPIKQ